MKRTLILLLVSVLCLSGCANRPMNFVSQRAGLTELDFYRARDKCSAENSTGGYFMVGPAIVVAAVAAVDEARKQNARAGYQVCMAQKGYVCNSRCAVDPASISLAPTAENLLSGPSSPVPSVFPPTPLLPKNDPGPRSVAQAQPPILANNVTGSTVYPAADSLPLYLAPARDSERIERLFKGSAMKITQVSGDWLKVTTESGKTGWVLTSAVITKD
jgi:uncharacterized protein YgiM (DUF1202 family)